MTALRTCRNRQIVAAAELTLHGFIKVRNRFQRNGPLPAQPKRSVCGAAAPHYLRQAPIAQAPMDGRDPHNTTPTSKLPLQPRKAFYMISSWHADECKTEVIHRRRERGRSPRRTIEQGQYRSQRPRGADNSLRNPRAKDRNRASFPDREVSGRSFRVVRLRSRKTALGEPRTRLPSEEITSIRVGAQSQFDHRRTLTAADVFSSLCSAGGPTRVTRLPGPSQVWPLIWPNEKTPPRR